MSGHVSLRFSVGLGSGEFGAQVSSFVDLLFFICATQQRKETEETGTQADTAHVVTVTVLRETLSSMSN